MVRKHRFQNHKRVVLKVTCKLLYKNVFQVLLKQDNTTQLVQDDQVKGPLRVRIFCSLKSEMMNHKYKFSICSFTIYKHVNQKTKIQMKCCRVSISYNVTLAIP